MSASARGPKRRRTPGRQTSRRRPPATRERAKEKTSLLEKLLQASGPQKRSGTGARLEQRDTLEVIAGVMAQERRQRRRALALVRSFFEDPMRFLVRGTAVRTSESRVARERQLRERLEALGALVDMMESEMQLLAQAEIEAASTAAGGHGREL